MPNRPITSGSDDVLPASTGTSRSLIERIRRDESEAWSRLVSLYAPMVLHWCRQRHLQEQDAADVFQEVFQAVSAQIAAFRNEGECDTFRGWLRRITENKIHDHFRRRAREPVGVGGTEANHRMHEVRAPLEPDYEPTESLAERNLFHRALALIRGEFEERTWNAFWRTAVDGQASIEIAQELSMSPGAVRVAKYRVLRRLREELGDIAD